jgi:hypothetical protein
VLKVAVPLVRVWVLSVVLPSRKATLPVGPAGVTVAVNVTLWPEADDVGATTRVVAVWVRPTDSVTAGEVLVRKLVSPL